MSERQEWEETQWQEAVIRRLTNLEESYKGISDRINSLEKQDAVDEVHRSNVENRLSSIEDTLKWLVRLIIGAIILAAIGFALGGGFALI